VAEIETHGTGQVERIADRAGMRLSFARTGRDRASAVSALSERIGAVEALLDRDGVQVRDRRLAVHDRWEAKRRAGAIAEQSYEVRITDLAALNDLIADLVAVEPTNVSGPYWELADVDEAQREAQRAAVADARQRAEGYAAALGRELGELVRIADGGGNHHMPLAFAASAASGGQAEIARLSLEPEPVSVSATCTMTWTIA
jgi:uncharacterized protein YggE